MQHLEDKPTSALSLDLDIVASQWLRAIRGKHSQVVVSRRLGYQSNIVYRWEAGHCYPSTSTTFQLFEMLRGGTSTSVSKFLRGTQSWVHEVTPTSPEYVAQLLTAIKGPISLVELAKITGFSRHALSRWVRGKSEPTLPEFLSVIDKVSLRLLDFIASFITPESLPCVAHAWKKLCQAKASAYDYPWSHAVLRALELEGYRKNAKHCSNWLAQKIGIDVTTVDENLHVLSAFDQIVWRGSHYEPTSLSLVDMHVDPVRAKELKSWWVQVGLDRFRNGKSGLFSFNLCSVSTEDYDKLEALKRQYYRKMVQIVESSTCNDRVVLYGALLLPLDSTENS